MSTGTEQDATTTTSTEQKPPEDNGTPLDAVFNQTEGLQDEAEDTEDVGLPAESNIDPEDDLAPLHESMTSETVAPFEGKVNDYELKLPKGVLPDNPLLQQFTALAKEKKVDPEVVQKSVEMLDQYQQKFFNEIVKKDEQFRQNLNNQFVRANKADPVYGGANYEASVNYAMKALRRFVPKNDLLATQAKDGKMGMLEYLKLSNSMNATPLWKFMVEVGKHLSESAPTIPGSAPKQKQITAEDAIYGMIS